MTERSSKSPRGGSDTGTSTDTPRSGQLRPGSAPSDSHAPLLPDIATLKIQARDLRASLVEVGHAVSHSTALELLARQHGYRDWNTLRAAARRVLEVSGFRRGARVTGRYLGHAFSGQVLRAESVVPDRTRLELQFDRPVDVVRFDSFQAFRQRVTCVVDADGVSAERTSDGTPHVRLRVEG